MKERKKERKKGRKKERKRVSCCEYQLAAVCIVQYTAPPHAINCTHSISSITKIEAYICIHAAYRTETAGSWHLRVAHYHTAVMSQHSDCVLVNVMYFRIPTF